MTKDGISDAELERYDLEEKRIVDQIQVIKAKMDDCRDERELLEDYLRYNGQFRQLQSEQQRNAARRAEYIKTHQIFDRELEQYDLDYRRLTAEMTNRRAKIEAGRLSTDDPEMLRLQSRRRELDLHRTRYLRDRDFLSAEGATDGQVMPGSIVTVRTSGGRRYTFVLTARPTDCEYPTEAYSSDLGEAVRFKKTGDRVLEDAHGYTEILEIEPGFRLR